MTTTAQPAPQTSEHPRRTRWVVGALTVWLPIYMLAFLAFAIFSVTRGGDEPPGGGGGFAALFAVHVATMVISFVLLAIYAIDIFRNPAVREDRRVMWLVLVLFVGPGAMPVYWWHYMRAPSASS